MTLRTPTTFNTYNDLLNIKPNKEVLAAHHDAVLNDQQFALDRGEILCSCVGDAKTTTAHSWAVLFRLTVRGRNLCSPGSQREYVDFCIRAKCTVNNDYVVGIYDPVEAAWSGITVSSDRTTWAWRGWTVDVGGYLLAPTDGSAVQYRIGAYVPNPGTGVVSVSGVGIFAANPS